MSRDLLPADDWGNVYVESEPVQRLIVVAKPIFTKGRRLSC